MADLKKIKSTLDNDINWFDPGKNLIGIDVGKSSIKIAVLKETPTGKKLVELVSCTMPPPDDDSKERQFVIIIETFKKLIASMKTKFKKANTVISAPSMHLRNLVLPDMPIEDLKESIRWEIEQNIPQAQEEFYIDHLVSGELVKLGVKNLEIEVVAVKKQEINDFLKIFSDLLIKPQEINIAPFALWNIFQQTGRWKEDEKIALINIGAETTSINIFSSNILRFTRDVFWGSRHLTTVIMQQLNINNQEAEKLKVETGIHDTTNIYPIIIPVLKQLSTEIQRSFDYYKAQFHAEQIDKVIISGGGAALKNIERFLTEELGTMVDFADLGTGILFDPKAFPNITTDALTYSVAIGAALTGGSSKRINLLPPEMRGEKKIDYKTIAIKSSVGVTALALVAITLFLSIQEKQLNKEKLATEAILKEWQDKSRTDKKTNFISNISSQQNKWILIFSSLSENIPDNVWLTELDVNENEKFLKIVGISRSEMLIVEFVRNLEKVDYFKNIKLEFIERSRSDATGQGATNFVATCRW